MNSIYSAVQKNPDINHVEGFHFAHSYSGVQSGPGYAVPPLRDIAIALGRICRWSGNGAAFFPVLLHSFIVADLVPSPHLKAYALLHDATESIMGDAPRGFKTTEFAALENRYLVQILDSFNLPPLTSDQKTLLKAADQAALVGEVWTVGVPIYDFFPDRDPYIEKLTLRYAKRFPPEDCIRPDGPAVQTFIHRFHTSLQHVRKPEGDHAGL